MPIVAICANTPILPSRPVDATVLVDQPDVKTQIPIEKSDAFLSSKITFGENAKNLVKYGEFSKFGRFRQKSRNGHKTPTQYRSNAHFGMFQKLQNLPCIYPSEEMHLDRVNHRPFSSDLKFVFCPVIYWVWWHFVGFGRKVADRRFAPVFVRLPLNCSCTCTRADSSVPRAIAGHARYIAGFDDRLDIRAIQDDIFSKYVPPHVNIFFIDPAGWCSRRSSSRPLPVLS